MAQHGDSSKAIRIDLRNTRADPRSDGPQWSHESADLDLTLLLWSAEQEIAAHTNHEVDVVLVAISGAGEVTVSGSTYQLSAGHALLIPKGTTRSIRCTGEHFRYLSIHRRRRGLWPTVRGEEQP